MASAVVEQGPVAALESEQDALATIALLLDVSDGRGPKLVGATGEQIDLPESLVRVLRSAVRAMSQDRAVAVVPVHEQLSTQAAAGLLRVSRPYLVRLLEEGKIPYSMVGTHRRIRLDDLMAYAKVRDERRRETLSELTRLSQELGLYSND